MTTRNNKGRNSGKSATPNTTTKVDSKDMSASAQRKRVLEYLRAAAQTTYSLRARGISHPAQRVHELIALGHLITSHPVTAIDSDGFMHRNVARYCLEGELALEAEHV
jgi:uncharacterized protein (DUF3084 family)